MCKETTKENFEFFKKECQHWIDYYGLTQWRFLFKHQNYDSTCFATFNYNEYAMGCDISLEPEWSEWDGEITDKMLAQTAFHEVTEIVFVPIAKTAYLKLSETEYNKKMHEVIRVFENTVFKDYWEKPNA